MRRTVFLLTLISFLVIFSMPVFSLELKQGRLKLVLHERTGRFSLYYLEDVRTDTYSSLFLDQDPRTTYLSVLVNNSIYRMGETSGFTEKLEKTSSGARFIWESSFLRVTQSFAFISSESSPLSNGIGIRIKAENLSEQNLSIGFRYLIDTDLGEKRNSHFETDSVFRIEKEREFVPPGIPAYIISRAQEGANPGLQVMSSAAGVTRPDRVILSNWKRLNDNAWTYDVNTTRNFNQLPYSINDSAVALYYNPISVDKGGSREVALAMGVYTREGYVLDGGPGSGELEQLFDRTMAASDAVPQDIELAVQTDLIAVRDLLAEINGKLESGAEITDAEIAVLYQVIEELKTRKMRYDAR